MNVCTRYSSCSAAYVQLQYLILQRFAFACEDPCPQHINARSHKYVWGGGAINSPALPLLLQIATGLLLLASIHTGGDGRCGESASAATTNSSRRRRRSCPGRHLSPCPPLLVACPELAQHVAHIRGGIAPVRTRACEISRQLPPETFRARVISNAAHQSELDTRLLANHTPAHATTRIRECANS